MYGGEEQPTGCFLCQFPAVKCGHQALFGAGSPILQEIDVVDEKQLQLIFVESGA